MRPVGMVGVAFCLILAGPAMAATITVNTTEDFDRERLATARSARQSRRCAYETGKMDVPPVAPIGGSDDTISFLPTLPARSPSLPRCRRSTVSNDGGHYPAGRASTAGNSPSAAQTRLGIHNRWW